MKLKRITVFITTIIGLAACNNDSNNVEIGEQPTEGVSITLHLPDAERVNVYSTATASECQIDSLWVLVFNTINPTTTQAKYDTLIDANITHNGQATQLLPQLPKSWTLLSTDIIVCIANVKPISSVKSIPYSNINSIFQLNKDDLLNKYNSNGHLPMYGEINPISLNNYDCTMTRAVAKIQVQLGEAYTDVTNSFNKDNVTFGIENYGFGGFLNNDNGKSWTTGSPSPFPLNYSLSLLQTAGPNTSVYVYPYPSSDSTFSGGTSINNKTYDSGRQHIILKKTVGGVSSYYRLDFYDYIKGEYLDIKRNHHYLFTIKNVRSEGYKSAAEAKAMPGSNIEYTVEVIDNYQHITSNGQYAIATDVDTAYVSDYNVRCNSIATVKFRVPNLLTTPVYNNSLSYEVTHSLSSTPQLWLSNFSNTNNLISVVGGYIQTSDMDTDANNVEHKIDIIMPNDGYINFKLGNITHKLYVKKK